MKTISAKKLSEAISKAQGVGIIEEPVTIGGCEIFIRNLRPDEYEAIIRETKDVEDIEYLNAYQKGHVARAIVELNGVDLRGTRFIEVEQEDPKKPGNLRTINIELHTWLLDYVLSTWSKEAIFIAFRKVGDVVGEAEKKAKEGIHFIQPDEANDQKFRRLLGELNETEKELPPDLVSRTLEEFGYSHKVNEEQVKAASEKLAAVSVEETKANPPPEPTPEPPRQAPTQSARVEVPISQPRVRQAPRVTTPEPEPTEPAAVEETETPEQMMARRTPLNQIPMDRVPTVLNRPPVQQGSTPKSRTAEIAELEGEVDPGPAQKLGLPAPPQEIPTLERRQSAISPKDVLTILEQPPVGGINPRYRPPSR